MIGHAATAGVSIVLICVALERAPGMVVSLTFTADLPIRMLAQYLVIPDLQPPGGGLLDIIGSVMVLIALVLPGFWDCTDKRKEERKITDNELISLQPDRMEEYK